MTAWHVHYRDKRRPFLGPLRLSLNVAESADPKRAARLAAGLARERLKAKGIHPEVIAVRCVG